MRGSPGDRPGNDFWNIDPVCERVCVCERWRDEEREREREGERESVSTHTHTHIHIQHTKVTFSPPFLFNLITSSVKKPLSPSSLLLLGAESLNPRPSSLVYGKEG
jgi:hypothetical protein